MSRRGLIVLKLGGSVLRGEASLAHAVHEIHRRRREGLDVVVVVSAYAGETDRAMRDCGDADPHVTASLAAARERIAASRLALAADRAGVPARVLTPEALGLRAGGDPLESEPIAVDRAPFGIAFARDEVAIVPGFTAVDAAGRTVVLGRGGSDLAAIFLADRLGAARCLLLKDVDGLYERDPAVAGPTPRRFEHASWDDALAVGGEVIQPRAVRHARDRRLTIELGTLDAHDVTTFGAGPSTTVAAAPPPRPLRVALLGCGTVGGGVLDRLRALPERFEVVSVAVRDVAARDADAVPWTDDPLAAARSGADVVVEVLGGTTVACGTVLAAFAAGADVVTANKTLLAQHGAALETAAAAAGRSLLFSAAVGGSMPLLERLSLAGTGVRRVRAVLNGTANFVLDRLREGATLSAAEATARERGLAEADAWRDLEGLDAADKLALVAHAVTGKRLDVRLVTRESLGDALARRGGVGVAGGVLRQVATLEGTGGDVVASVLFEPVRGDDPLARVDGARNAAVIERVDGARELVRGTGAGREPTAESVVADLLDLARARRAGAARGALAS